MKDLPHNKLLVMLTSLLLVACSGPSPNAGSRTAAAEETSDNPFDELAAPYTLDADACRLGSPELLSDAGPAPVSNPIAEADLTGSRPFAAFGGDKGLVLWAGPTTSEAQDSTWFLMVDLTGPTASEPALIDNHAIRDAQIRPAGKAFLVVTSRYEDGAGPNGSLWKNEALLISQTGEIQNRIPLSRTAVPRGLSDVVDGTAYLLEADAGDPWSVSARRITIDNGVLSQSLIMEKSIMSSKEAGDAVRQGDGWWAFNDAEFIWLNGEKLPQQLPSTRHLDLGVHNDKLLVMGLDDNSGEPVLFKLNDDGELLSEERRSPAEMPRGLEPGLAYTAAPAAEATFLKGDPADESALSEPSKEGTHVLVGTDTGWHQPENGSAENTWFGWTSEGFAFIYTSPDQSRLYIQKVECNPSLAAEAANAD